MNWKKYKIGIFMGGPSGEHEVSLRSGRAVYQALREERLNVIPIVLPKDLDTRDNRIDFLLREIFKERQINLVFNSLHGRFGEDGQLQKILDKLKIPYTGSKARTSYLAMDKIASRRIFEKAGIPVPRYKIITKRSFSLADISLPAMVKPAKCGSSIGVSLVEKEKDLSAALDLAFAYDRRVIVEQYLVGKEITVAILDNQPLPVIQIVPRQSFYNYQAKYEDTQTEYVLPADLPEDLERKAKLLALTAHLSLGCSSFSRVDMILHQNKTPVVLELNTIPGLTERSLLPKAAQAQDISFNQLCLKILESAF